MKWVKKFLLATAVTAVIVAVVGLFLPKDYTVERSIVIDAEPAKVHALVGDLTRWSEWSPWEESDPSIRVKPGSQTTGVGASQSWTGGSGNGELIFTDYSEQGVEYDLIFEDGAWTSEAGIKYGLVNGTTGVSWWMKGSIDMPVVGGYMALMIENFSEPMFERGLERLKLAAEAG